QWLASRAGANAAAPWFAGYVDITAVPVHAFENPTSEAARNVVLSFIVADKDEPCAPTWGTAYTIDAASEHLDLERRIARLEQQGGDFAISFGGFANDELATACSDPEDLLAAYRQVVSHYDVSTIDLDIEGDDLADDAAIARRAVAIARLQA